MRPLTRIVARNSIVTLISKFLIKLLSFGFTILIARTLGEAEFGRYALIWSFVAIFATASDFGLGMYTIRELAKSNETRQSLAENVIAFRLILAFITFLLIGLTTQLTNYSPTLISHILLAATTLLFYAVQDPLDSILQAKERVDLSSLLRIVGQLTFVLIGAIFLYLEWGITGLILASLCNVFISATLAWGLLQQYMGGLTWRLQPKRWGSLFKAALPFGVIGFALNWSQKIDTVILSLFWPVEVIGWYNAAYNLILGFLIVSNALNIALYPTMSKEAASGLVLQGIHKRILKYIFIVSLPLASSFFILNHSIILYVYGEAFTPAILPLSILSWMVPLLFLSEFLRYTALVVGKERQAAGFMISASLLNIILNFIFIPAYGLLAASLITLLTEACLVILYLWQLRIEIPFGSLVETVWKPTLASGLMSILFSLSAYVPLILLILLGGLIYIGTLLMLGELDTEERRLLRTAFRRGTLATPQS